MSRFPRLPPYRLPNALSAALRRRAPGELIDLTCSNPTAVGLRYPWRELSAALARGATARYEPHPRGALRARQTLVDELGGRFSAERLMITASTSEAYGLLLKLLCAPGDRVAMPRPGYPLLEHLVRLEGATPLYYRLRFAGQWQIDLEEIAEAISAGARAIVVVSPDNPTGHVLSPPELAEIARLCAGREVALIADEVFSAYPLRPDLEPAHAFADSSVVSFTLGGLSKLAAMPQLKLSWIGAAGPAQPVSDALEALELIADAYLSVATPVQHALPELLRLGAPLRAQLHQRIGANRRLIAEAIEGRGGCSLLPADGGWYGVLRVPAVLGEEQLALRLLERHGVVVHPGYFYDFEREAFVVLSMIVAPKALERGIEALLVELELATGARGG